MRLLSVWLASSLSVFACRPEGDDLTEGRARELGTSLVVMRNLTAEPLYVHHDGRAAPLWLSIENPPMRLAAWGSPDCGGEAPAASEAWPVTGILPGESVDFRWSGHTWDRDEGARCWSRRLGEPGTYSARACAFTSDPGPINPFTGTRHGARALRCAPVAVTLPSQAEEISSGAWR